MENPTSAHRTFESTSSPVRAVVTAIGLQALAFGLFVVAFLTLLGTVMASAASGSSSSGYAWRSVFVFAALASYLKSGHSAAHHLDSRLGWAVLLTLPSVLALTGTNPIWLWDVATYTE